MKEYLPYNKFYLTKGVFLLPLLAIFVGVIEGFVIYFITRVLQLLILSFIVLGFTGAINAPVIMSYAHKWKIPNKLFYTLCVVLASTSFYIVYRLTGYAYFLYTARSYIIQNGGLSDLGHIISATNEYLQQHTGNTGFWGYLVLATQPNNVWIFWLVEYLMVVGIGPLFTRRDKVGDFCGKCKTWYKTEHMGSVNSEGLLNWLKTLQASESQKNINLTKRANLEVYLGTCDCIQGEKLLTATESRKAAKGKLIFVDVLQGLITHQEVHDLKQSVIRFSQEKSA